MFMYLVGRVDNCKNSPVLSWHAHIVHSLVVVCNKSKRKQLLAEIGHPTRGGTPLPPLSL